MHAFYIDSVILTPPNYAQLRFKKFSREPFQQCKSQKKKKIKLSLVEDHTLHQKLI